MKEKRPVRIYLIKESRSQENNLIREPLNTLLKGRGGGQVVSVLVFYPDGLSSNPAEAYSFSVKFVFEANKNIQKEAVIYKKAVASSPVDVIGDNAMVGCCKSRDEF